MKIAYGIYGMPEISPFDSIPRLAALGYQGIEVAVGSRWSCAPEKLPAADRDRLRALFGELGIDFTAALLFVNMLAEEGAPLDEQHAIFREACRLSRQISPHAEAPVVVSTLGSADIEWERDVDWVAARVQHTSSVARDEGCRLALEPHVGGLLDRPSRVLDLMERAPEAKINFDISHFWVQGMATADVAPPLVPHSVHTHIKDGVLEDGKVRFLLPGEGPHDLVEYFRAMHAAGYRGFITVEVSAHIYRREDYDPWAAAQFCWDALSRARAAAGLA